VLRRRPVMPEESPGLRLAVFGGVVVAAASIGVFGGLLVLAVLCVPVIAAGHYWSWRSRRRPRRFVRVLVGLALLGATLLLLAELFLGVGADPFPQGSFLLLLMAITSFDVRSRANCYSSLVFGLLGLYAAASVAYDATMALCAVAFAVAVLAAFALATRADAQRATVVLASAQQPPPAEGLATPASSSFQPSWALAALCGVVLSCAVATYAIVPAYVGALPIYPVSADLPISQSFTGEVLNPVLPLISLRGPNHLRAGYYGFAPELRLGAYGPLDATVVMRVRSTGWSYWRMQTFDSYTGRSWRTANGLLNQLERGPDGAMEPAVYPLDDGEYHAPGSAVGAPTATIRQTFTLAQPGPNLIAAAYRPIRLYFPSTAVAQRINADDLIADQPLPAGATYSVVSQAPDTTPALLRAATGPDPWFASSDDLVLPALPARLTAVARAATVGATTRYDRVMAMIAYLDSHARYDLTTPARHPRATGHRLCPRRVQLALPCLHSASQRRPRLDRDLLPWPWLAAFRRHARWRCPAAPSRHQRLAAGRPAGRSSAAAARLGGAGPRWRRRGQPEQLVAARRGAVGHDAARLISTRCPAATRGPAPFGRLARPSASPAQSWRIVPPGHPGLFRRRRARPGPPRLPTPGRRRHAPPLCA